VKFSISQNELLNALTVVSKGVSTRSTLPVLSGILIEAQNDQLTFISTDLVLSITYSCAALIEEKGSAVFPAKFFLDIVKNLNNAAVSVYSEEETAEISCDGSSFTIKTLNPEDFPAFPDVDTTQTISVPFIQFASMIKKVGRVVSKDESRAILTGVLITAESGLLKMVATDSYRLSVTQCESVDDTAGFNAVVSGNFLMDIASLPKSEERISLSLAENQIVVRYGSTVFVNRRIEGAFPNYQQLLPKEYNCRVGVSTSALISAVKRASLVGSSASPVKFSVFPNHGYIRLSASSQDVGSVEEEIPCDGEGEEIEIAFNCAYVLEGLNSIETDKVYIELQSSLKPGILTSDKEENYLYLVMPVRIS